MYGARGPHDGQAGVPDRAGHASTLGLIGLVLVAAAIAGPLAWLPGIAEGRDVIGLFSQQLGMSALIAMAVSQLIATRIAPVEWISV